MLSPIRAALRDWATYHRTLHALLGLDPRLRADLGLDEADLRRLARAARRHDGPVGLFELLEKREEPAALTPRRAPSAPARLAAQGS